MDLTQKPIFCRITIEQENYLNKLKAATGKSISEIVRELIQKEINTQTTTKNANFADSYSIKTYQLLKQFIKDNDDDFEATLEIANTISEEILDTI